MSGILLRLASSTGDKSLPSLGQDAFDDAIINTNPFLWLSGQRGYGAPFVTDLARRADFTAPFSQTLPPVSAGASFGGAGVLDFAATTATLAAVEPDETVPAGSFTFMTMLDFSNAMSGSAALLASTMKGAAFGFVMQKFTNSQIQVMTNYAAASSDQIITPITFDPNVPRTILFDFNATTKLGRLFFEDMLTPLATRTYTSAPPASGHSLRLGGGAAAAAKMRVADTLWYDRVVSARTRTAVQNALKGKYGLS